jgi:2-polyprenyl-6-methoxyphenol hydroxylase-like FAD-dependent oxidoreductase
MRIAVIGAGIGGLVAAAGLQRQGHEVHVFERRAEPGAVGAGITLGGNALAALDDIGLGDVVRGVSGPALGSMRSGQRQPSGRWLVSLPASETSPLRSMHRVELHHALLAELATGSVHADSRAQVAPDGEPEIEVTVGPGNPSDTSVSDSPSVGTTRRERFDLVIAADGLRSAARSAWGLDPGVRFAGYTAWRGVTESAGHLADEVGETWGRGARFGIVRLPDDRVYWFAALSTPTGAVFADDRAAARDIFGGWHEPIAELIEATPRAAILRHDIYDLARFPHSFAVRRGVLLGDAAHAMTPDLGQGAGQAIEDAATLVLLLSESSAGAVEGTDLDAMVQWYSRLRRARTRPLWRGSRAMGRIAQAGGPLASRVRDAALRSIPGPLVARAAATAGTPGWPRP